MSHLTTGQIAELVAIDSRGPGIRSEVQDLIRRLTAPSSTVVDLDADPFVPERLMVVEHRKGGSLDLAAAKLGLYLSEAQKRGSAAGDDLRKDFADKSVLNANGLDFLLKPENQHLVPEDWKGKYVFFWGTIYRDGGGNRFVRYLCWDGGRWVWYYDWLGYGWLSGDPAAVVASSA